MKTQWMLTAAATAMVVGCVTEAHAFVQIPDPVVRQSHVETVVTDLGNGFYRYSYTVWNDSVPTLDGKVYVWPRIIGWEIPLDSPAFVSDVTSPETWSYRFLSAEDYLNEYGVPNPFDSAWVLQWYDYELYEGISFEKSIVPVGYNAAWGEDEYEPYVNHFGFVSPLGPTDGPYAAIWQDAYRNIGDPPLPGGGVSGGSLPYTRQHSMPDGGTTAMLLGLGLVGLQFWRKNSR